MRVRFIIAVFLLLVLLAACARQITPPSEMKAPAAPAPAADKAAWEVEWEGVVAEAKKEGTLVIYTGLPSEIRIAFTEKFKQLFGLNTQWVTARGEELARKLISERRAGLYLADIYFSGTTTYLHLLKPEKVGELIERALILPEVLDPNAWFGKKLPFFDKDRQLFAFGMNIETSAAINRKEVKLEDMKSYKDFLNPRWKGKIIMEDPSIAGGGLRWFSSVGEYIMSWDYLREFAKQEPVLTRDSRLQVDWLALGKYPVAVSPHTDITKEAIRAGAPISELVLAEGTYITSGFGNIALINRAAHPNAAKVFINWLLSKEGQLLYSRVRSLQVLRVDIPVDHLPPEARYDPARKIYNTATEEFVMLQDKHRTMAKEIFASQLK